MKLQNIVVAAMCLAAVRAGYSKDASSMDVAADIARYESGGSLAEDPSEEAVEAPKDMKLVLCIGQSNMSGRAKMEQGDCAIVPGAYKLDRHGRWVRAKSPYHFDRQYAAVGPVDDFVKLYLADHPGETIGVVPCAVGGSAVSTWLEGGVNYTNAVSRAKAALANGKFIAILWHQGETDAAKRSAADLMKRYPGQMISIAEAFRRELGDESIPFIAGEIGRWLRGKADHAAKINPAINAAGAILPYSAVVSSVGLTNQDRHHFDRASQRRLAERYYKAMQKAGVEKMKR